MRSICFVLTSPIVLNHYLINHLCALANHYHITVCVNTCETKISERINPKIKIIHIPFSRQIHIAKDTSTLITLIRFFYHNNFDAIHSLTPKGGLLAMLAARITKIPIRTHSFTGQVWATQKGMTRFFLKTMDKLLVHCATHLNADSSSQVQFLIKEKIIGKRFIQVFGAGSISGVDLTRFVANPIRRSETRQQLGITDDSSVFLFLGRLNSEKGVKELAEAFSRLYNDNARNYLIYVGPDECNMIQQIKRICSVCSQHVKFIDLTPTPERYIDAADVLCLPSYREGFGSSIIEAAAMGVPSIASNIYGVTDAIIDEITGILFKPGNINEMLAAMNRMLDIDFRKQISEQAQERAHRDFSSEIITQAWLKYYSSLLDSGKNIQ